MQTPQGIKPNLHSFYSSDLVRDEEFYAGGKVGVQLETSLKSLRLRKLLD